MSRTTIDFGIDLGTTNSAISVMNAGEVETLKVGNSEVVGSCIYFDPKGNMHVGEGGKSRLLSQKHVRDVHAEFKRTMGTDKIYKFKNAGKEMNSEELSALVLKELRRTAASRFNDDPPNAAVITIPAMFESSQRNATAKAGELAGFQHVELLQEPVAAAMAAGFQTDSEKAFWVVYDFGGGTFDASLVSIRDGQLSVVNHAGNNFLGGADLDWAIVEKILLPALSNSFDATHLNRGSMDANDAIATSMNKLKLEAENAKKVLSKENSYNIYAEDGVTDANGESYDIDITITTEQMNEAIADMVSESVDITKKLIKDANLTPANIEKVVMAGGTTFVPLVREKVSEMGIDVDYSLDPMTIVSVGAAMYASTRRMPSDIVEKELPKTGLAIQLEYVPVVKDTTSPVGGRITNSNGEPLPSDLMLNIKRGDGGWETGQISIDETGMFFADVELVPSTTQEFEIVASDSSGAIIDISPSRFTVTHGLAVSGATLPMSIRICKADGTAPVLIKKGTQYPAKIPPYTVRANSELKAGSENHLKIPFADGESDVAERNCEGAAIIINGKDIETTLPAGCTLEISGEINVSGVTTYECFVEVIDETFISKAGVLEFSDSAFVAKLDSQIDSLEKRIEDLESQAKTAEDDSAKSAIQIIKNSNKIEDFRDGVKEGNESNDISRIGNTRNSIVNLHNELDDIEFKVTWPSILSDYNESITRTRQMIQEIGDDRDEKQLTQIENEGQKAIDSKDGKMLKAINSALDSLQFTIIGKHPSFWIKTLADLARRKGQFSDESRAQSLLEQGARAAQVQDVDTMRSCVQELWSLLPPQQVEASRSAGFGSGVI